MLFICSKLSSNGTTMSSEYSSLEAKVLSCELVNRLLQHSVICKSADNGKDTERKARGALRNREKNHVREGVRVPCLQCQLV